MPISKAASTLSIIKRSREKLHTYPAMRRLVKGWLKAGVMEALELSPIKAGTPQGGVVSPLLANIAHDANGRSNAESLRR
jgi:retron-type reverse transcriptase